MNVPIRRILSVRGFVATSLLLVGPLATAQSPVESETRRRPVHPTARNHPTVRSVLEGAGAAQRSGGLGLIVEEAERFRAAATERADPTVETDWSAERMPAAPDRIAVQHAQGLSGEEIAERARAAGFTGVTLEPAVRPGWTFLSVTATGASAESGGRAARRLAIDPAVDAVSPVHVRGGEWAVPTSRLLVCFRDADDTAREELLGGAAGLSVVEDDFAGLANTCLVHCASGDGFEVVARAAAMAAHPGVAWAEPELLLSAELTYTPNDPMFGDLWGFVNTGQSGGSVGMDMDVDLAWDKTRGNSTVQVMVLDTGTAIPHPDLNESQRIDFTGTLLNQCDNHGTAVAGCISARIDNNLGVVGVSPNCPVVSARMFVTSTSLPCGSAGSIVNTQLANAINWGSSNGIRVSNSSFQMTPSSTVSNAYNTARTSGMSHFAAAGNDGGNGSVYPGSLSSVQEVGAIDRNGQKANFSRRGCNLIFAPGVDIRTTDRTGGVGYTTGDYAWLEGTSFASPYVAGVAALCYSVHPAATPADIETILRATTTQLSTFCTTFGHGLVNANNAVVQAQSQANQCQIMPYCHPALGGWGTGNALLSVCEPAPGCSTQGQFNLTGAPANQIAWVVFAGGYQPTPHPIFASGELVHPAPITSVQVVTDAQGRYCLTNVNTCGTVPLFVQMAWTIPGSSLLGLSNVVVIDPETSTSYQVGAGQTFGRIGDAIATSLSRTLTPPVPIFVNTGTYDETVLIRGSITVVEAAGATAVLRHTGTSFNFFEIASYQGANVNVVWDGIDIVAAGTVTQFPINVYSDSGGTCQALFRNLTISDEPGVQGVSTRPFISASTRNNGGRTTARFHDVDLSVRNFTWGPLFDVSNRTNVELLSSQGSGVRPPGSGLQVTTTCENVANVNSNQPVGFTIRDAAVDVLTPRGPMLVSNDGVIVANHCRFTGPAGTVGIGRFDAETGSITLRESLVEARSGSTQPLFLFDAGSGPRLGLLSSAIVFDAAATVGNAVVDAPRGGEVVIEHSTVQSTTGHPQAVVVSGPKVTPDPATALGKVTGRIDTSIFELPGSDAGVVRAPMGSVELDGQVRNVRHCPSGFPSSHDMLPGEKLEVDPNLATDGFHLTAASASLPRLRASQALDLDGDVRTLGSTTFGCDHTPHVAQAGLHVGPGQAFATIQSAIQAAQPTDTIVVHGGTYDEVIDWNKPVDIVEAWGEIAKLEPRNVAGTPRVIQQSGWPNGARAVWDGVDIVSADITAAEVIDVAGTPSGTSIIEFRNCEIRDDSTTISTTSFFDVSGPGTFLTVTNCRVAPTSWAYTNGIRVTDVSYVSFNDCYVSFRGGSMANVTGGGQVGFNGSIVQDGGTEIATVDGNQSSVSFYRSIVRANSSPRTFRIGGIGSGACRVDAYRSIIDARAGTWDSPFTFTQLNQGTVGITNSAVLFHSARTTSRGIIDASLGGEVRMAGSTVRNYEDLPQFLQYATVVHGPAQANATLSGDFQSNVFDIPGSTRGAILNFQNMSFGTVTATANQNVVHVGSGSFLFDRLTGSKFNVDPRLASDGVHLTDQSRTVVPTTSGLSLVDDVDGERRFGTLTTTYLGCDDLP